MSPPTAWTNHLELLWVPPDEESHRWTPESLRRYIENYGSWEPMRDGSIWRITPMTSARTPVESPRFVPHADVFRSAADPRAGSVDLDVPLNGDWSDLTAQFEFQAVEGGVAVSLHDLHVLWTTRAHLKRATPRSRGDDGHLGNR